MKAYDAIVIGSGPNGLAAAITVAERGGSALLLEGAATIGGGMRTEERTRAGFRHDVCSAVHPLALSSPFFLARPLAKHGLEWVFSPSEVAHPLDDGSAVLLDRSIETTARGLGSDGAAYRGLVEPLVDAGDRLFAEIFRPVLHVPKHPLALARFGLSALRSATALARTRFREPRARALFAGLAGHAMIPLDAPASAAIALVLATAAHLRGWPIPRGGSATIARALASYFVSLGGEIRTGAPVRSLEELPPARRIFLDSTPKMLAEIGGDRLSESEKRRLLAFRYGPGVWKLDFALSAPVPWRAPECARAATVHLGGSLEEIARSERAVAENAPRDRAYVLVVQPSRFDPTRAPAGKHTLWAYCHVPSGSCVDRGERIVSEIERFAPGFRETILARRAISPADLERENPNAVGGDIGAGAMDLGQVLARPRFFSPYRTPLENVFLCSASTPPGPGVHGMCGYHAARTALGDPDPA